MPERIARRGLSRHVPHTADLLAPKAFGGEDHHVRDRRDPIAARLLQLPVFVADTDCQRFGGCADHQRTVHQQCDSARTTTSAYHVPLFLYHAGDCTDMVRGHGEPYRHDVCHSHHVSGLTCLRRGTAYRAAGQGHRPIRQISGIRHRRWPTAADVHSARLGSVGCAGDGQRAGLPAGAARPARLRPPPALLGIRQTVLGVS